MKATWSIRAYQKGNEKQIFELVKTVEDLSEKERWLNGWVWLFIDNPAGTPIIWLAEHDGKIVSQYPCIMENMKVSDKTMKGAQLIDTMTHPQYRHQGICTTLGKKSLTEIEKGETSLVYCFPTQQVYPLHLKSGWLDVCAFQVLVKPLNLKNILQKRFVSGELLPSILTASGNVITKIFFRSKKVINEDILKVKKISHFDDCINEFWNSVSKDYKIITIRDQKYLNWRYVDAPNANYTIYVAEEGEKICGYIILGCRGDDELKWGYIYDIIAPLSRADIIQCLITKAIEYFTNKRVDIILTQMVATDIYRKGFLRNGFIPHAWSTERFLVYNASTEFSDVFLKNPNNWFIQLGDLPAVY